MSSRHRQTSRSRRWVWGVGLATLIFQAAVAWTWPLPGAFRKYGLAAEQWLRGELPTERLMDFSPLYFHLSVALEHIFDRPEVWLHGLQILLVAVATALFYLLLEKRLPRALALLAAFLLATDRHILVYERVLEPEALLLFFLMVTLTSLDHGGRRTIWIGGVAAALALATRPTFLPLFLVAPVFLWLSRDPGPDPRLGTLRWRASSLRFLVPVVGMLIVLGLRSAAITGDFRTPTMNPGTVFFEGNNPLSRGTSAIYPPVVLNYVRNSGAIPDSAHQHYRTVARVATGKALSIREVNAFWAERALRYLRDEPGRFLRLLGDKLAMTFNGFRWHDIPTAWQYDLRLAIPSVPFALLSSLALLGCLFAARQWRRDFLFFALAANQTAVMLVFYVSARQRMVLLPAVIFFAAVALQKFWDARWRSLLMIVLVVLMMVSLSMPNDAMRDELHRRRGYLETEQLLNRIREKSKTEPLAHHDQLVVEAVATAPWWLDWLHPVFFPRDRGTLATRTADLLSSRERQGPFRISMDFDLAELRLRGRQLEAAETLLVPLVEAEASVYRGGRQPSTPELLLARVEAWRGRKDRALELLEKGLRRFPGDSFVLAERVVLTANEEDRERLFAYLSPLDAQWILGQAYLAHGRFPEAANELGDLVERLPEFRDARVFLAAALAGSGKTEAGARQYLRAMEERLEPVLEGDRIADLFRAWSAENPQDLEVQTQAARVLHHLGFFDEALYRFEALSGQDDRVRREIDQLRLEVSVR